jgi:hypothetical protein
MNTFMVHDRIVPMRTIRNHWFVDENGLGFQLTDQVFVVERLRDDRWSIKLVGIDCWWMPEYWHPYVAPLMFCLDEIA